jgi:hypothetical protein
MALMGSGCALDYGMAPIGLEDAAEPLEAVAPVPAGPEQPGQAASPDASSSGVGPSPRGVHWLPETGQPDALGWRPLPQGSHGATAAWRHPQAPDLRLETFDLSAGMTAPMTDFLFVVDDSVSMRHVLERFQKGFASLAASSAFPAGSRLAVMNTMPASYENLSRPHASVSHSHMMRRSPGFLRLLSGSSIERFRATAPDDIVERFNDEGCARWFTPDATNAQGTPCLLAHTQVALVGSRVEAGLHAFKQLLMKREGRALFRPGAAVNVIFVSDTHDPGFLPSEHSRQAQDLDDLMAEQPDFEELRELVLADNLVASFRAHAIAPEFECVEPWARLGPAYFTVAEAGAGVTADICTLEDYAPVIAQIAQQGGVMQEPVVHLGRRAAEVEAVRIGGRPVGFSMDPDHRVLLLDGVLPAKSERLQVLYRLQRAPTTRQDTQPGKRQAAQTTPRQR